MAHDNENVRAILERLERLERQNRRLKRAGVLALVAVGVLIFMGQSLSKGHVVEAQRFIVKNAEGRVRTDAGLHRGLCRGQRGRVVEGLGVGEPTARVRSGISVAE